MFRQPIQSWLIAAWYSSFDMGPTNSENLRLSLPWMYLMSQYVSSVLVLSFTDSHCSNSMTLSMNNLEWLSLGHVHRCYALSFGAQQLGQQSSSESLHCTICRLVAQKLEWCLLSQSLFCQQNLVQTVPTHFIELFLHPLLFQNQECCGIQSIDKISDLPISQWCLG